MISAKIKKYISPTAFFPSFVPIILLNTLISLVISFSLLRYGNQHGGLYSLLIGSVSFVAHYFLLNLAVGILSYVPSMILSEKVVIFLRTSLFLLFQIILVIDTKIYSIFHFHINSLVWNVITTEGAADSVTLGKTTIVAFLGWFLLILFAEIIINRYFGFRYGKKGNRTTRAFIRTSKALFIAGLCLIIVDKAMYAYADLVNNTEITKNGKLYPLYQPLTIKKFASQFLNIEVNRELNFRVSNKSSMINYPKKELVFDASKDKKYNVIVIVIEGLRFDMLDRETMPNTWAFGHENMIFKNHYSGGNGSRFGVFSLLYGINGTYWHSFLAHRVPPLLIDTFIDKGYDIKILSSTLLTFPEFRKTAFIKVPEHIEDDFTIIATPGRDRLITEKITDHIMTAGKSKRPFFTFLFYNSSHQPYRYPKEFEKFLPVSDEEINYFTDTKMDKAFMLKNRYKNAVYYNDYLIGKIITSLKQNGLLDKTIVLVTGDHGEEFYENGYFGHTASFDDYQIKTLFVLSYPGVKHRIVERLTSHCDLVPTLMESLGCVSPEGHYSQGFTLLSGEQHPYVITSSWYKAAIIDDRYKIIYSTQMLGSFEVYKADDYTLLKNTGTVIRRKRSHLLDASLKMSEFYR